MKLHEEVKQVAHGKWRQVLPDLGVEDAVLNGKHQPCPNCGGKDRFRFTDKDGEGLYYCSGCEPGSPIDLLMVVNGWTYKKAVLEVAAALGIRDEKPGRDPKNEREHRKRLITKMLGEGAEDRSPVVRYLKRRGLSTIPEKLRFHPELDYFDGDGNKVGAYPAMLGLVLDENGRPQSVHRTYLTDAVEARKKLTPPVTSIKGGAIRLWGAGKTLGVAEGIETAIACYDLAQQRGNELPMWAVVSAKGMEQFKWPDSIERLVICADNDEKFAGQAAAYKLAHRAACAGLDVEIRIPKWPGKDWLDVLNMTRREAA